MTTLENVTTGQTFTNGTTQTVFEYLGNNEAKNTVTGETITLTDDTHVYVVQEAKVDNGLTELETTVLKAMQYGDHFEDMPTVCFNEIVDNSGLRKNQIKGVLGSLTKKGLLFEGEYPDGETCYHLPVKAEAMLN